MLVNNAGLALGLEPEQEGNLDDWETMIDTNIKALLTMTRLVVPGKVKRTRGHIIKNTDDNGVKRYDFQFENKRGYKVTIEGLSEKFNKEYWNYAKLISSVLRYRMPIDRVIRLVGQLELDSESINTWKNGVERALKKYVVDGTAAKGQKCPNCGNETLVYQEGCLICTTCGTSRCG